jgi:hypothetical protein
LKHIIREEDGEREVIPESPGQDDQASPINVEKEIVLPNLKVLSLEQLSSIVCFSFGWCYYFLFPEVEGPSMSKADHKICYYTRWFNECSIRGAADLT